MSFHRSLAATSLAPVLATLIATVLVASGCADDQAGTARPVSARAGATSNTAAGPTSTTGVEALTSAAPSATPDPETTTTTIAAPPVTKPLTTAPPSPLLTEVTAAYLAGYADLLAAEETMDENYPALGNHIFGGQLDTWREVIRGYRADGITARDVPSAPRWVRVEEAEIVDEGEVRLNLCRMDSQEAVLASGTGTGADKRPYRYLETMWLVDGGWKWAGREWIDSSASGSDCAVPSG